MKRLWVGLALLGALGCSGSRVSRPRVEPGAKGSALAAERLDDGTEEPLWVEGRVTIVDFWATWCGPCVRAMPAWAEIHNRLEPLGAEVVAVSVDEDRHRAEAFVTRHQLPFRTLWDPNGDRMDGHLPWQGVIPFTVVVDCNGRIRSARHGYGGPEDLAPIEEEVVALTREDSCSQ